MRQEFRDSVMNVYFLTSFLLMLGCFLGMSVPEWIVSVDWGAEFRQSALQQSISGIFFGGVMLLLPFCSCLPTAIHQVDELRTSIMPWKLIRSSIKKYAVRKIVSTLFSGGLAVSLAFMIHAILWNFIALPCDIIAHPYHEIGFHPETLYANWYSICYGLPMYISMTLGIFICGAIWAIVALAVSIWIPDKILTITIPICIYYLLFTGIFNYLFGWRLPHPATLYNDGLTWNEVVSSSLEYIVIFIAAGAIYILGLKRRAQHA